MASAASIAEAFARVRAAGFTGRATKLADIDLPQIGHEIGVGEDEIHAVIDVETSGGGFDKSKRPKMLFEPHVFWRNLSVAERTQAERIGIAYEKWRPGNYPTDSYPRLSQAMAINETAALKAASWGLGQILGENFVAAGYTSPQQMVLAFVEGGETEHLAAMVRFIKANKLDDELRAHNWAGFARGYNGPGYAANNYHTRLAAAFKRWQAIKDTPWEPGQDAVGKPVPIPPVETAPPFPPAPRNGGPSAVTPPPAITPPTQPTPAKGFWASMLERLRTAYPPKG